MAEPETEPGRNRYNRWWIWTVVAAIAILILWITFDNRTDIQRPEDTRIPDSTVVREPVAPDFDDN